MDVSDDTEDVSVDTDVVSCVFVADSETAVDARTEFVVDNCVLVVARPLAVDVAVEVVAVKDATAVVSCVLVEVRVDVDEASCAFVADTDVLTPVLSAGTLADTAVVVVCRLVTAADTLLACVCTSPMLTLAVLSPLLMVESVVDMVTAVADSDVDTVARLALVAASVACIVVVVVTKLLICAVRLTRVESVAAMHVDCTLASYACAVDSVCALAVDTYALALALADDSVVLPTTLVVLDADEMALLLFVVASLALVTIAADTCVLMDVDSDATDALFVLAICACRLLSRMSPEFAMRESMMPLAGATISCSCASMSSTEYWSDPMRNCTSLPSGTTTAMLPSSAVSDGITQPEPSAPGVPLASSTHSHV